MSNQFSKEEQVAFEDLCQGFEDQIVASREVTVKKRSDEDMERSGDTYWVPQPYIMPSYDGMDQTGNFKPKTQLSVPVTLGFEKAVPWTMDAKELRDALQENRLGLAARQRLASDINVAVLNVASQQGTLVVTRTTAPGTYDDVAQCDALMNEQGVMMNDRSLFLSSRSYNGMAGDLANRQNMVGKSVTAYERSFVGEVAGFNTFKMDYANRIAASTGAGTIDTRTSAVNYYTPRSTSVAATGERSNVDNRYQVITISSTANYSAGDAFTVDGVEAVHHITKQSTGQLKTFRVISVDSGTTMTISPPMISAQGGTEAEVQYQNVSVTAAAAANLNVLNIAAADINPFWHRDAIQLTPGRYEVPTDSGAAVMRATTDQGIEIVMTKQFDINTMITNYRIDANWGVTNKAPEQSGILLFNQV